MKMRKQEINDKRMRGKFEKRIIGNRKKERKEERKEGKKKKIE